MVISKKGGLRLLLFASIVVLLGGIFYASAAFDSTRSWHPLQQISTSATSGLSVDANDNGLVDDADRVGGYDAAALMAAGDGTVSAAGGTSSGTFRVVLFDDKSNINSECPAGFNKLTYDQMVGQDKYIYMHMSKDSLYLGSLDSWDWAGSEGGALRADILNTVGADGFVCWQNYDVVAGKSARPNLVVVSPSTPCPSGYNTFIIAPSGQDGSINGYNYIMQTSYGLFMGQLYHINYYAYGNGETVLYQYNHEDRAGKTCWKVDNVVAAP